MSERATQRDDGEVGTCPVCGDTFAPQWELSKRLIDAHDGLGTADGPGSQDPTGTPPAGN